MRNWKMMALSMAFITLLPIDGMASIGSDLGDFFNGLNGEANVTSASAYKGQSAGFYSGGSVFARSRVKNFQLVSLDLPTTKSGCGGIDLYMGGFSYINKEQLQSALKSIASNASSYAFMLAMKTVSPLIETTLDQLQTWANKVNMMNINSCQAAASLVGGVWPKTNVAKENVCETIGTSKGYFTDWAAARQGCGESATSAQVLSGGKQDPAFRDLISDNTNMAWAVISKNAFFSSDTELAQLMMSLSGTQIYSVNSDKEHFIVKPSLGADPTLLNALLNGGEAKMYRCDETSLCLNPHIATVTISTKDALAPRVRNLIESMRAKIASDTPLSGAEQAFLESTPLPLYKMLNVESGYQGVPDPLNLTEYAQIIAISSVFQYVNESLTQLSQGADVLQFPKVQVDKFQAGVKLAKREILNLQTKTFARVDQTYQLVQRTQQLEASLARYLSTELNSNWRWASSMR